MRLPPSILCWSFKGLVPRSCWNSKTMGGSQRYMTSRVDLEIERKFPFNNGILQYCAANASSVREVTMADIYFDSSGLDLTTRDMWMRQRNDKLELKWPMQLDNAKYSAHEEKPATLVGLDFYQESTDSAKIGQVLAELTGLQVHFPTSTGADVIEKVHALSAVGIEPFGAFLTHRKRYNLQVPLPTHLHRGDTVMDTINLFVDIDTVKYSSPKHFSKSTVETGLISEDLSTYQIGEVEFNFAGVGRSSQPNQQHNEAIMRHVFDVIGIQPAPVRGKVLEYLARFRPAHYEALRKSGVLASKGL